MHVHRLEFPWVALGHHLRRPDVSLPVVPQEYVLELRVQADILGKVLPTNSAAAGGVTNNQQVAVSNSSKDAPYTNRTQRTQRKKHAHALSAEPAG